MEVKWTVTMILLQKKNDVDLSDKIFNNCRKRLQKKAAGKESTGVVHQELQRSYLFITNCRENLLITGCDIMHEIPGKMKVYNKG